MNLTKTVRKLPINDQLERMGHYIHDDRQLDIKYDELPEVWHIDATSTAHVVTTFARLLHLPLHWCWHVLTCA